MPLYEYECSACGQRFELIQRFADLPAETCVACGKGPVHKLLSAPAVHFKGTGWYVTDYAKKGAGAAGKAESGGKDDGAPSSSPASAAAGATTTESKPAAEAKPAADSSK